MRPGEAQAQAPNPQVPDQQPVLTLELNDVKAATCRTCLCDRQLLQCQQALHAATPWLLLQVHDCSSDSLGWHPRLPVPDMQLQEHSSPEKPARPDGEPTRQLCLGMAFEPFLHEPLT